MSQHITEQLVEQVARAAHERQIEAVKASGTYAPPELLRPWDDLPVMEKFHRREYAMRDLQTIVPVLLAAGWLPPVGGDQA